MDALAILRGVPKRVQVSTMRCDGRFRWLKGRFTAQIIPTCTPELLASICDVCNHMLKTIRRGDKHAKEMAALTGYISSGWFITLYRNERTNETVTAVVCYTDGKFDRIYYKHSYFYPTPIETKYNYIRHANFRYEFKDDHSPVLILHDESW